MSLLTKGIRKLSELQIDADKDWQGRGIVNIGGVAQGMARGHILQHNGSILETLPPSTPCQVLTSMGFDKRVEWAPGGMYLNRYFPAMVSLTRGHSKFGPDRLKTVNAPLATPYGIPGLHHPSWFTKFDPRISRMLATQLFDAEFNASRNVPATSGFDLVAAIGGVVADDGGVQSDQTPAARIGPAVDQQYTAGDDNYKTTSSSAWEAQTFTPAVSHTLRAVRLKLYRSGWPGTASLVVKAVDGSGHPTGIDLAAQVFETGLITENTAGDWYRVELAVPVDLVGGVTYALILKSALAGLRWRCDVSSPVYAGGRREYSATSGASWISDAAADFMFQEYGTTCDVILLPPTLAVDDACYFGHPNRFGALTPDIGRAGAGTYTLAWEYFNGSVWTGLVNLVDGTDAFRNAWSHIVSHRPQADWTLCTILGMNRHWIRARVADVGSGYSQPLGTFAQILITS